MHDVAMNICCAMTMLSVRSYLEYENASLWYFVVYFTQGDCVMLISHTKGYDEKKFPPNPKVLMVMLLQGVNLLWPMTSLW